MIALSWNVRGLGKPAQFPCSPAPTTDCFAVGSVGERREEWWFGVRLEDGVNIRILGFSQGHIDALLLLGREVVRITGFYGNPEVSQRGETWWVGAKPEAQMRSFREVIDSCGLVDVQFTGSPFTWSNGHVLSGWIVD
ncbi:hypothetical protein M0R45_026844 [Rubus argutus]|uniref:Uncharacterized protein n=1 Tax=Rubus argutus TaxID=59490 RepID=A0AAW1X2A5_RUBAR